MQTFSNTASEAIGLAERLSRVEKRRAPGTVGRFDGHDPRLVEATDGFVRHASPDTDDFFHVPKGRPTIGMDVGEVTLGPGKGCVVPMGGEHRPVAHGEVHVLPIEAAGRPNTGGPATAAKTTL